MEESKDGELKTSHFSEEQKNIEGEEGVLNTSSGNVSTAGSIHHNQPLDE